MYDFLIEDSIAKADKEDDAHNSWIILIVDDEPAIHTITKFALEDEYFDSKKLTFLSAFNAREAMDILRSREDIALVLLDVVMETESSGLEVAAWIRETLFNKLIRIVLRTGQPGQAPENTVILDYDIFDYKNKTELTAQKLFSCVISGLRSYRDVLALSNHSKGLKQVVEATADIFKKQYVSEYTSGVLLQLTSLLYFSADAALVDIDTNINFDIKTTKIIAAVGGYEKYLGESVEQVLSEETMQNCLDSDQVVFRQQSDNKILFSYQSRDNHKTLLFLEYRKSFSQDDMSLINLFVQSVAIAQERMRFWQDTEDTLNEMISLLSKTVEDHANQGDQYFTGVTKVAMLLAKKHGLILKRQISQKVKNGNLS
ncbi:MAG: CheY-like chemotaxis protein [Oceanospirillaceae bacterium]|jgi:CheY-like chemotaxis protein